VFGKPASIHRPRAKPASPPLYGQLGQPAASAVARS
jgi:hypothetical protein